MAAGKDPTSWEVFEAVADTLIAVGANDDLKTRILAAVMDAVGVPMLSIEEYRDDHAIVTLFNERGIRLVGQGLDGS